VIEERRSIDSVENVFYDDLHERFFYTITNLLHNLLIKKGSSHIVEA